MSCHAEEKKKVQAELDTALTAQSTLGVEVRFHQDKCLETEKLAKTEATAKNGLQQELFKVVEQLKVADKNLKETKQDLESAKVEKNSLYKTQAEMQQQNHTQEAKLKQQEAELDKAIKEKDGVQQNLGKDLRDCKVELQKLQNVQQQLETSKVTNA